MKFAWMSLKARSALLMAGLVLAASCALQAQPNGGPPEVVRRMVPLPVSYNNSSVDPAWSVS